MPVDRLEARLSGWSSLRIEVLEPLAPPGETNRGESGVGARRHDVREGQVEVPQGLEGRTDARRQLLKRDLAVEIEPALSD
ncbi:MAG TPA: hypothetical protein VF067_02460 [Sphingomicrobium sp.]